MEVFNTSSKVLVTCNKRLAPYLLAEVEELGFEVKRSFSTGLELEASVNDCITLNLNLRTASQILYSLKSFSARTPEELYAELVEVPWEELIDFAGYFSITSNVENQYIRTPLFANVKVKDAIVDRIRSKVNVRPDSGPLTNKTVIHLYWRSEEAEIYIDTSGEVISKHGYRKLPGKAPMLEALACGTILATKWDKNSSFVNPMCGSGTLAIEAALLATNKSPGFFRMNYGFMHILGYDEQVFFSERRKLKDKAKKQVDFKIIATDISEEAIDIAEKNAKTAGVDHLIEFRVCDFEETEVPAGPGIVMFNPEYGERLGVHSVLEGTYKRIGDFMKQKCGGYFGYIFTGNPDLAKKIGLKASRRIEFYNGKLDCRLLEYELYQGSRREESNPS
ncbi:putative N6-adenine-specific DNA methylase [Arcticibacter tournemirensis]|uniref:Class I SAM-dependent RNA methyltransferase n=1 Tax=Arcticibacter tournemirensis TaxID=699437 RepID=A0A5M9HJD2_9SPHI|nr:class I SAM-dependent RNA methyltransferase [Arcticibacter tournemirensis]KAA8485488.1 class I SAM-dependent RNA methyltransferase [Arcticibacter tournemirensis]TQM48809.1 putative N6-adenine-specific DNA methylase [Arcticibacter tournemirensis]